MTALLKDLVDFLEPIGLTWLLLTVMTALPMWKKKWRQALLPGFAWLILTTLSVLPVSNMLLASLERAWPPVDLATLPECDAIMVLGGGLEPSATEPSGMHMKSGADRLMTAIALARQGKGRRLIIGGGIFKTADGGRVFEADGAREWLAAWDLTQVPVQSLGGCHDTHDEAVKVAALVKQHGWQKVALVTSAYHMRRTQAVFAKAGVPVLPVPCNYESTEMRGRELRWLSVPNGTNLLTFEVWMHEIVGWWVYRLRGWI
ncbi:MAG: YdcF family protein [Prosthecobacter sp.]